MRNIQAEREFLMEEFPEMEDRTMKAPDEAIAIMYDMLSLEKEELEMSIEYVDEMIRERSARK